MTNTKLVKIDKSVKFTPVTGSSLINSYAAEAGDLALKFNSGVTYIYENVDAGTVASFKAAASKGKFFGSHIKNKFTAKQAE